MVGVRRRCRALVLWEVALRRLLARCNYGNSPAATASSLASEPGAPLTVSGLQALVERTSALSDAAWMQMDRGWRQ